MSINIQQAKAHLLFDFLEEQHRAVRQLSDGGFISEPTLDAAQTFSQAALEGLIKTGSVKSKDGTTHYNNPAAINSIRVLLTGYGAHKTLTANINTEDMLQSLISDAASKLELTQRLGQYYEEPSAQNPAPEVPEPAGALYDGCGDSCDCN